MIKNGLGFHRSSKMSFSQRKGIKPMEKEPQIESMDDALRNSLWNNLHICYWNTVSETHLFNDHKMNILFNKLWFDFFKSPIDTLETYWDRTYEQIRRIYFTLRWYEVYDFIEFVSNNYPESSVNSKFMNECNRVLEREFSAYRFVSGKITSITSKDEIKEIEIALNSPLTPVNKHLATALDLLSDRKSPDYRNAIKESISAVEAICKVITGDQKATLGQAIDKVEKKVKLHTDLKDSFKKLYGYTSDADGIRHALLKESSLNFEDAKFMLVSCSAFINYLISKSAKAGIKF
jgi:hypothetical protein